MFQKPDDSLPSLASLQHRIDAAKGVSQAQVSPRKPASASTGMVWGVVSGATVGALVGYGMDRGLDSSPVGLIVGFLGGFGVGLYGLMQKIKTQDLETKD